MSQPAPTSAMQQISDGLTNVVALAARSAVAVHSARSHSSGLVWRQGLVVTADEALAEDGDISVTLPSGEMTSATVVGRDPTTDIAVLRVDRASLLPIALECAPTRVGALALAVGSHNGAPIAAFGIVSFVGVGWRSARGGEIDARLELDLSLRRAGEGGPALDSSGRALGMAVFGPRRQVLVIPGATIERVASNLVNHGRIARGYLGLGLRPIPLDGDAGIGVMVMSVDSNGPGAAAGIKQGDVIIRWSDQPIRNVRTVLQALGPDSIGSTVKLSLRRGGEPAEAHLLIAERPAT